MITYNQEAAITIIALAKQRAVSLLTSQVGQLADEYNQKLIALRKDVKRGHKTPTQAVKEATNMDMHLMTRLKIALRD